MITPIYQPGVHADMNLYLTDEIARLTHWIAAGRCADFGDYKAKTGELLALENAQEKFNELVDAYSGG